MERALGCPASSGVRGPSSTSNAPRPAPFRPFTSLRHRRQPASARRQEARLRLQCSAEATTASEAAAEAAGPAAGEASSSASSGSPVPQAKTWELDFCSRPILDERGKKVGRGAGGEGAGAGRGAAARSAAALPCSPAAPAARRSNRLSPHSMSEGAGWLQQRKPGALPLLPLLPWRAGVGAADLRPHPQL